MNAISKRNTPLVTPLLGITVTLLLLLAGPALADDKLEIHGFLTQAWGEASFVSGPLTDALGSPTGVERDLGLDEDGTFDYRSLALQFRYSITDNDIMIVQLSHEANGISPVDALREDVELDWAFYEHRFGAHTRVKVGRFPIPLGIYNEIRDVGTILPFYRPAFSVYSEGGFTSESIDGIGFSRTIAPDSSWNLDLDLYYGEFEYFETQAGNVVPAVSEALGIQLWLNTPVSGLRFGYSYQDREETGGIFRFPGTATDSENWLASVEGVFSKWSVRGEYRTYEPFIPAGLAGPARVDLELVSWYVELGINATELLQFYAQVEQQAVTNTNPLLVGGSVDFDQRDDFGLAVNFAFSPQVVLKAEYHWLEQEGVTVAPVFTPGGLRLQPTVLGADDGNYAILALSASF